MAEVMFRPFSIYYTTDQNRLVVHMHGRDGDGEHRHYKLHGTEPHFFTNERVRHQKVRNFVPNAAKTLTGEPLHKVTTRFPFDVPDVRSVCGKTWQADVYYENVVRIEYGIRNVIRVPDKTNIYPDDIEPIPWKESPDIKPRFAVFDIETMDKGAFPDIENPTAEVVSIAIWDSYKDLYTALFNGRLYQSDRDEANKFYQQNGWSVQTFELDNEKDLLLAFRDYLHQVRPDIIAGWNSGNPRNKRAFDVPYLDARADKLGVKKPNWREFAFLDLGRDAYRRWHRSSNPRWSLDYVSQSAGFEGKNLDMPIWKAYEKAPGKLLAYNVNDVYLTKGTGERFDLMNFFTMLSGFAGVPIEDSHITGKIVDNFIFHYLRGTGFKRPTKQKNFREDLKGAFVAEMVKGNHEMVIEIDLAAQYPNAIRTFNMSPDTRVDNDWDGPKAELEFATYRTDERGLFPKMLDDILELRYELKNAGRDTEQRVVKEVANTAYGQLGSPHFRDYDPLIANDITGISRRVLKHAAKYARDHGYEVLYGDTDSIYLKVSGQTVTYEEAKAHGERIVKEVNKFIEELALELGAKENYMEMEVEHVYDAVWFPGSKKRYACIYRDPDGDIEHGDYRYSMKARGIELRRSDAAPITQETQKEVLTKILVGEGREAVVECLRNVVEGAKSGEISVEKFFKPRGLNQPLESYDTNMQHVRAAKFSNRHLGARFGSGDKPLIIFGHVEGKPRTDVFALEWGEDLPEGAVIDWDTTLDKTIFGPLRQILDDYQIRRDEITNPSHRLEEFF